MMAALIVLSVALHFIFYMLFHIRHGNRDGLYQRASMEIGRHRPAVSKTKYSEGRSIIAVASPLFRTYNTDAFKTHLNALSATP